MLTSHEYNRAEFFATVNEESYELLAQLHERHEGDAWEAMQELRNKRTRFRDDERALELLELLVFGDENETELEWDY